METGKEQKSPDNQTNENSGGRFAVAPRALKVPVPGKGSGGAPNPDAPSQTIEERASEEASKAGQRLLDWKASYAALTNKISGFYTEQINDLIHPINKQMGEQLNGLRFDLDKGPASILQEAKDDYASLHGDAVKYQRDRAEFNKRLEKERRVFSDLSEDDIRKTEIKTPGSWFLFFAILGLIVLLESAANMGLLASALEGGLVQAFLTATLVSVVNVMGIGAGIGFLCAFLFRKLRGVFYAALPLWFGGVVLLNLVIGRHREKEVIGIEAEEQAANAESLSEGLGSLVVAPSEITEVSLNVVSWHFESVLFFLLGIVLSCFGFYKGLFFIRPGENLKPILDKLDTLQKKVEQGIDDIAAQGRQKIYQLRKKVADEFVTLNSIVDEGENAFQDMEEGWGRIIDVIEHEFVNSYNQAHPEQKISSKDIRETDIAADFPATQADRDAIIRGKQSIKDYRETGQGLFYDAIQSINAQIGQNQSEYRAAIHTLMHDSHSSA